MPELFTKAVLAYLLGSLLGSLIVGRLRGGVDIRQQGSGNAGGTNALRTQGAAFAVWVMLIDVGKGWLATSLIPELQLPYISRQAEAASLSLALACATAVVLGHIYPLWYQFRGGKGAATLVGVLLSLDPHALIIVIAIWLLVVVITGFVGLATMMAAAGYLAFLTVARSDTPPALFAFGIAMLLLVCYTHRSNIGRMLDGTEHRATKLWLLRPR